MCKTNSLFYFVVFEVWTTYCEQYKFTDILDGNEKFQNKNKKLIIIFQRTCSQKEKDRSSFDNNRVKSFIFDNTAKLKIPLEKTALKEFF